MEKKNKQKKSKEEKKRNPKKVLLCFFAVVLLLFLIAAGTGIYVLAAIFDQKPEEIVVKKLDYEAYKSALNKISNLFQVNGIVDLNTTTENYDSEKLLDNLEALTNQGNVIDLKNPEDLKTENLLKNINIGKVLEVLSGPGEITLTKAEVNALIAFPFSEDMGEFHHNDKIKKVDAYFKKSGILGDWIKDFRIYDAWFDEGRFTVKVSIGLNADIPFGSYCNIELVFVPQIIEHHLNLDIYSAKAGDLPSFFSFIPMLYIKDELGKTLLAFEETPDGKDLLAIINSLVVDENKIEMEYNFKKLSDWGIDNLPKLEILNNSSDISTEDILNLLN